VAPLQSARSLAIGTTGSGWEHAALGRLTLPNWAADNQPIEPIASWKAPVGGAGRTRADHGGRGYGLTLAKGSKGPGEGCYANGARPNPSHGGHRARAGSGTHWFYRDQCQSEDKLPHRWQSAAGFTFAAAMPGQARYADPQHAGEACFLFGGFVGGLRR